MTHTATETKGWFRDRPATGFETVVIGLILFSLPSFEGPKNIFGFVLLVSFIAIGLWKRTFGRPLLFEWPIWGLVIVLYIASFTSEFRDMMDMPEQAMRWTQLGVVAVIVGRLSFDRTRILLLCAAFLAGGIYAVLDAYWVWSLNGKVHPEMRSVGQVNHSAMYVTVMLGAGLGMLLTRHRLMTALAALTVVAGLTFVPFSRSIVTGLSTVLLALVFLLLVAITTGGIRPRHVLGASVLVLMAAAAALFLPQLQPLIQEFSELISAGNVFSFRDKIFFTALEIYDRHFWFGSGLQSYEFATSIDIVRSEVEASGRSWSSFEDWYFPTNHGHNLWITILVERGVVGVALLLSYFVLAFVCFLQAVRKMWIDDDLGKALAVGSILILLGFILSGLGNTTMQNEHGQAGLMLIALSGTYFRKQQAAPKQS